MLRIILLLLILCTCWIASCDTETGFVGFTGEEYHRLLTNDSMKIWKKQRIIQNGSIIESDECLDLTLLEFGYVDNNPDSRYFEIKLDPRNCDGDSSVVQSGSWKLMSNSDNRLTKDTLRFVTGPDTTYKWIEEISALNLVLESRNNEERLIEEFVFEKD